VLTRRSVRSVSLLVGLGVSVVFSYFAVRHVDWNRFTASLAASNYWWLAPALVTLALGVLLRAKRWALIFTEENRPPLGATTKALLIGYLFNIVLPGRPGELLRVIYLHEEAGTSRAEALGTALAERIFDVLALLILLFVAIPWLPEVTWLQRAGFVAIGCAFGLVVLIVVLARWEDAPLRYVLRPLRLLPGVTAERVASAASQVVLGLVALRRWRVALPAVVLTFSATLMIAFSFWLVMRALELGVGFGAGLLVVVTTTLALVIPSSPAAVGVFEGAVLVALHPYGIDDSHGLSYAVVLHAINIFPFVAVGFWLLQRHTVRMLRRGVAGGDDAKGGGGLSGFVPPP
jgi:uncharacterized protein (TIRG00374 family)